MPHQVKTISFLPKNILFLQEREKITETIIAIMTFSKPWRRGAKKIGS